MHHPVIETERLTLRQPEHTDADELVRVCGDWDVSRWTTRVPHPYSPQDAMDRIKSIQDSADDPDSEFMQMALCRTDGHLVGLCSLIPMEQSGAAEIGFLIGKQDWGKGYGGELASAMVADGFDRLGLQEIFAAALPDNPGSIRLQEKLGFQYRENWVKDAPARGQSFELEVRVLSKERWSRTHG
ncbi:GNAT family N-acetyltransferase [Aestuariispira ectoiniformans]|uniref:GNAT family N-acetyltransferase n=1 Tax=Aestuariispira ectoiniformans TaxID=2775080 RepID=UPI00223B2904|nr:GNAT family N-acetyltransferase [Aestuariispira ectoiniformans]